MSFLHILKPEERRLLRTIVKKVHLQYVPNENKSDREADKLIATIGPATVEQLLKAGKDNNIDNI
ncbi:hypothetical protein [uncultured Mediterranean phage uvMED]|jgi:hypothetical protein|nr:hypothetical protein [uncultured Mediterranean phage uvMED]|tara:strand:+ start:841 stop:1035 length:195 start_codon:yes stop_codon:yes gene_type:complete